MMRDDARVRTARALVSVETHTEALAAVRAFRAGAGRARAAAAGTSKARHYELSHRYAIQAYAMLVRAGQYLARAGLTVPGISASSRPERAVPSSGYGRCRDDALFRCLLTDERGLVCGALVWSDRRDEHLHYEHHADGRDADVLGASFALAPRGIEDAIDDDEEEEPA